MSILLFKTNIHIFDVPKLITTRNNTQNKKKTQTKQSPPQRAGLPHSLNIKLEFQLIE